MGMRSYALFDMIRPKIIWSLTLLLLITWPARGFYEANFRCGVPRRASTRIGGTGATVTEENEYPWQGHLNVTIEGRTYLCGGSLVDASTLISAAHCFIKNGVRASGVIVTLGQHDIDEDTGNELVRGVSGASVTLHPEYDPTSGRNDIALVSFNSGDAIDWGENPLIRPICLPSSSKHEEDYYNK